MSDRGNLFGELRRMARTSGAVGGIAARVAGEGANDWVVYHTGSSPEDDGEVKKVRLAVLDQHPNARWRPVESNQNFLGFYRLKILQ